MRRYFALILAFLTAAAFVARTAVGQAAGGDGAVPRYAHIFVIVLENKDQSQVIDPVAAPNIAGLAKAYGLASHFYAESHPSEPNYVAMVSGDTYGIRDDDAYYCNVGTKDPHCEKSMRPGYVNHTLT